MSDAIHERMLKSFPLLHAIGWKYIGYRMVTERRVASYHLRFEKVIIDKLAYSDVKIADGQCTDRTIDLKDLIESRLREVEIGLIKARHHEMSAAA